MGYSNSRSDYIKKLNQMRSNYQNNGNSMINTMDDSTQVGEEMSAMAYLNTPIEVPENNNISTKKRDNNFLGNTQRIYDTIDEFGMNIQYGIGGFIDGIGDALIGLAGGIGKVFGADTSWAEEAMKYDWKSPLIESMNSFNANKILSGDVFKKDYWNQYSNIFENGQAQNIRNQRHANSFTGGMSDDAYNIYQSVGEGIGYVLPSIGLAIVTGGGSTSVQAAQLARGAAMAATITSAGGSGMTEALNDGANYGQAMASGLINAAIEGGTELVSFGIGKAVSKLTGKVLSFGTRINAAQFDEIIKKASVKELGSAFIEEGLEEAASELLSPFAKTPYKGTEAFEEYNNPQLYKDTLTSFVSGGVAGAIAGGIQATSNKARYTNKGIDCANDYISIIQLHEQATNEAKKGSKANQELIANIESQLGDKIKSYVNNMNSLKVENPKAFDNVIKLLQNPFAEPSMLENNFNKDTYESLAREVSNDMSNMKKGNPTRIVFGTEEYFDELNNKNSQELNTELKNRAFFVREDGTNIITIDPRYKSDFYEIVSHEAISHGLLDDTQGFNYLENYIENDSKLKNEYHNFDNELKELYGDDENTLRSERMARFLEKYIKNHNDLQDVIGTKSNTFKDKLKSLFTNIKNYLDPKRDSKLLHQISKVLNSFYKENGIVNNEKIKYTKIEKKGEYSDEFRRIQEESRRELNSSSWQERSSKNNETLRRRLSDNFKRRLENRGYNSSSSNAIILKSNKNTEFRMYENIDGDLFHDCFEIDRTYLNNGELVDLHNNYGDCTCYLSDDGLSGFAITKNGDLVSVFNLNESKKGFLSAISSIVKDKAKTLDCYISPNQNLQGMYQRFFDFKTTSIMDYNMDFDHDDIAKNHSSPQVAFMVNSIKEVETRHFNKNQYDEAKAYQESFVNRKEIKSSRIKVSGVQAAKDYAQHMQEKVLNMKTTKDVYDMMVEGISSSFDVDIDIKNKSDLSEITTIAFNKLLNKPKELRSELSKAIDTVLNSEINYHIEEGVNGIASTVNTTLEEHLKAIGYDIKQFKEDSVSLFEEVLKDNSNDSKVARLTNYFKGRIAGLIDKIKYHKSNSYYTIQSFRKISQINEKLKKHTLPNVANKVGDIHYAELNYYKGLTKGISVTKSNQGISPKSIDHIINNFSSYTEDNISKFKWITFNPAIKENVDFLRSKQIDGKFPNRALTFEENKAVLDILSFVSRDMNSLIKEESIARHKKVEKADAEVKVLHSLYYDKNKSNVIQREIDLASSVDTIIARYFGSNSDTYKILYTDVMDAYNNQLLKQWEYLGEFEKFQKEYDIKPSELAKEYSFKGEEISMDTLLDMYCQTQTSIGLQTLQDGGYNYVNKNGKGKHLKLTAQDISTLHDLIPDKFKKFADKILIDLYNGSLKKYKANVDKRIRGFEDVIQDDFYYPTNKAETTSFTSDSVNDYQNIDVSKVSLNQERKNITSKPLKGMSFVGRYKAYTNGLTKYGEMYESLKTFDSLMNQYTLLDNGRSAPRSSIMFEINENFSKYLNYLRMQIAGESITKDKLKLVNEGKMFSNLVSTTLYGNLSVVLKQTGSIPTIMMEVKFSSWVKGLVGAFGKLANYKETKANIKLQSGLLAQRWGDMDIIKSKTLTNNLGKVAKFFGVPMEAMDEAVVVMFGYTTAQYEAEALGFGKIGTESNDKAAINILNRIVTNTQSNAIPMKMSMNRAGASGVVRKALSYFSSDLQNKVSYINLLANEKRQAKKRLYEVNKILDNIENKIKQAEVDGSNYDSLIKQKELYKRLQIEAQNIIDGDNDKKAFKLILSTLLSALMMASIEQLVERIYGRKGWNENSTEDFVKSLLLESTINNLPYVSNLVNSIEYDQKLGTFEFGAIQSFVDIINNIKEGKPWHSILFNSIMSIGTLTGLPLKNLYNLFLGVYKNVSPDGYKIDATLKGYSETYIKKAYKESLDANNTNKAKGYLGILETLKSGSLSDSVENEIINLTKEGHSVLPKSIPTETEDKDGNLIALTSEQISQFKKAYSEANVKVEELLKINDYSSQTNENKAKIIKSIFDAYYSATLYKQYGITPKSKLAKLLVYTNGNLNINDLVLNYNAFSTLEVPTNSSRKNIIISKLNHSRLSKVDKLLVMDLLGYSLTDENKKLIKNFYSINEDLDTVFA